MRRLLLIHPATTAKTSGYGETKAWGMPPLGLGYVAALTPEGWEVRIVDEHIEEIPFGWRPDLVGIGAYSLNAPRAYQIAGKFREEGVPVVLGGIHASMVPEEAEAYVDAVVIGEAESVWGEVVEDSVRGTLKKRYTARRLPLVGLPIPRRDLFSDKYEMDIIQTARGCPFNCDFCSVAAFNGAQYRQRPVEEVLDEIGTIKKKFLYIIDDNVLGFGKEAEERAIRLFKGMIDRKFNKIWGTQASINFADNDDVLKYAYKSGCRTVYIGFESVMLDSLKEMRKSINIGRGIEGLKEAAKKIHRYGIGIVGAFIVGNDHDNTGVFRKMHDFMEAINLDVLSIAYLTPLPGTRLFERLKQEERIIYNDYPQDWERYDTDQAVIKPKAMSIDDLVLGYRYLVNKRFARKQILLQFFKTLYSTKGLMSALFTYSLNKDTWKYLVHDRDIHHVDAHVNS